MASSGRLYRNFIILQEDARGYANSSDKALSGYSKIEARGDICKITFYAQNLRKDNDKYHMMLICCKKDHKKIVDLGPMNISDSGKCDVTKEYNTSNIGGIDVEFENISGAAIAKYKEGSPVYVMCGFLNGEQPSDDWKSYKIVKCNDEKVVLPEKKVEKKVAKKPEKKVEKKAEMKEEAKKEIKKEVKEEVKEEKKCKENEEKKKVPCEGRAEEENNIQDNNIEENNIQETISVSQPTGENLRGKFDEYEEEIERNKQFDPRTCKINGPVGDYFESIAESFEKCDDDFKEIKYCKWYKVKVHDLYEMCDMSNYNKYTLAYYPMLNYYPYIKKYGYFNLGYKCDSKGNLNYIVYGVPGKKDKDEQPYDGKTGFVTWTNGAGKDNVGCWLMFYDYKNSTVVVPMQ